MRKTDFLPQDITKAMNEKRCIYSCLDRIETFVNKGDFEAARQAMNDIENSISEIEHLQERKTDHDRNFQLQYLMTRSIIPLQPPIIKTKT